MSGGSTTPRQAVVGLLGIVLVIVGAHGVSEWLAHRRAERALTALSLGAGCANVVSVAHRFANTESVRDVRARVCGRLWGKVTLNLSLGMSLNYLLELEVSADGRLVSVSSIGAW